MWAGRFARRRRLEGRFASHSLSRFSFCALAFLSCASGRFQNSPYLRVSCSAARQRGGVNQWRQGRRLSATITVRARRWRPPHGHAWRRAVRVQSPVAALGVHWRQGSGFYGHAPCEEPQNPCESRRARRPAPPNATPAWIRCPPAGAPRAVRWQQYKAGTLPGLRTRSMLLYILFFTEEGMEDVLAPRLRRVGHYERLHFVTRCPFAQYLPWMLGCALSFRQTDRQT